MTDALEATFANVEITDGSDRRRRWRLQDPALERLEPRQETTIEALEIAVREAKDNNRLRHARALEDLRDQHLIKLPVRDALRAEADAEAVLSSLGHVARPGPQTGQRPAVMDAVIEALRGPFKLRVSYGQKNSAERILEPHGVLLGLRSYLVARQPSRGPELLNFRMDRILDAASLDETFIFEPEFSIDDHAAKAFGAYQDPAQYGEVVWKFAPAAAERAAGFQFHPHQKSERQPDGSLIVSFNAAGWLEMAWFLYQWGDAVEVLAPSGLRKLTEDYRRSDFDALP
ncbi:helix-turn-helix transcriptional regulator [Candidatus Halocynthiibacter alkanivorans]|uniref:helix-turn-helix transcriptional regulator n=1 Tax=Candidatus Halocynthiibacter alkanivorans TaxID=2267619 RepID=UPI001F26A6AE|nr:WYL domain-containing protein [Candidatus Halocynthiibacter alkanivorans]